jgi:hypothetical protein
MNREDEIAFEMDSVDIRELQDRLFLSKIFWVDYFKELSTSYKPNHSLKKIITLQKLQSAKMSRHYQSMPAN